MVEFLAAVVLIGVPFLAIGFAVGYATGQRRSNVLAIIIIGLGLMAFGAIGMASIGLVIYPIGCLIASFGIGRSVKSSQQRTT